MNYLKILSLLSVISVVACDGADDTTIPAGTEAGVMAQPAGVMAQPAGTPADPAGMMAGTPADPAGMMAGTPADPAGMMAGTPADPAGMMAGTPADPAGMMAGTPADPAGMMAGAEAGMSAGVEGGERAQGACTNEADEGRFMSLGEEGINTAVETCVFSSCLNAAAQPEPCQQCISEATALSDGCSGCFVEVIQCTLAQCLTPCFNPDSPDCASCREANCLSAFDSCAGELL